MTSSARVSGSRSGSLATAVTAAAAVFAFVTVLVPARGHVDSAVVALLIVLPILAAGLVGGRWASGVSALVGAAAFDFWFTRPYESLKMSNRDDWLTALVLAVVAIAAAEIGLRFRGSRRSADAARNELRRFFRLAELAAIDTEPEDMVSAARAELIEMWQLADCTFESGSIPDGAPRLGRHGALDLAGGRSDVDESTVPSNGLAIELTARGTTFGHLWLVPGPRTQATREQRFVASAIASETALVLLLEATAPGGPGTEPYPRKEHHG